MSSPENETDTIMYFVCACPSMLVIVLNDDGSQTITVPNANTDQQLIEIILNDERSLGTWSFKPAE